MSIMDLDIPFSLTFAVGGTIVFYSSLTVLAVVTWQVLIVAIPMVYVAIRMQVMNFKLYCNSEIVFTLFQLYMDIIKTFNCASDFLCFMCRDTILP
jgi:hypothetical protein